jgi:hypothetical protein
MEKRPRSIVHFEWAYWLAMVLAYASAALTWDQTVAQIDLQSGHAGRGTLYMIWSIAFWTPVNVLAWFFAAHRRSVGAKWLIVGMAVTNLFDIGGWAIMGQIGPDAASVLSVAFLIPSLAAVWLLFRPESKRWFEDRSSLPDVFS